LRKLKKRIQYLENLLRNESFLSLAPLEEIKKRERLYPLLREVYEAKLSLQLIHN